MQNLRRRRGRLRKNCCRLRILRPGTFLWSAAPVARSWAGASARIPAWRLPLPCWRALFDGVYQAAKEAEVFLAAQCCEHLNRSIVIEREAAKANGYQIVSAIPQPHAGGSWATNCWQRFNDPVLVEEVRAAAGMDIGGTLIGMHLRRVAVPVRLSMDHIGQAILLCARTRPPFIGGSRAVYSQEEVR